MMNFCFKAASLQGMSASPITAWQVSEAQSSTARRLEIVSFEHDLDALKLALHPDNADALFAPSAQGPAAGAPPGSFSAFRSLW